MACAYHQQRPFPFREFGPGCQFGAEQEFFDCGGKQYCQFHLPMADADGNPSLKQQWDKGQVKEFNQRIFTHIESAKGEAQAADFAGVVFPGNISFSQYGKDDSFPKIAFFQAAFSGYAYFRKAAFSGDADFREAAFSGYADFREAAFSGDADFSGNPGGASLPSNSFHLAVFENAGFKGSVSFNNRRFTDTTSFKNAKFHRAPGFHNAHLHQDTDFTGAKFLDSFSDGAARAYRTLKLAMGAVKARGEEADFYALEQERLRHMASTPKAVKIAATLYKFTSDYGRSFVLPLFFLLAVFVLFTAEYAILANSHTPGGLGGSALFSFDQIVRPFKFLGEDLQTEYPVALRLLAVLQTVLSLACVTLFILAVRRRFKLN